MAPYFNNPTDQRMRIMSALCYMSSGIIGLLYILLNGRNNESTFFRFHFIQAILLGIFTMLISWAASSISGFVLGFLGLFGAAAAGVANGVSFGLGLIMEVGIGVLLLADVWGIIQSLRGKYADMPVVSKIVRSNMR